MGGLVFKSCKNCEFTGTFDVIPKKSQTGRLKGGQIVRMVKFQGSTIYQTSFTYLVEGSGVHKYSGQKKNVKGSKVVNIFQYSFGKKNCYHCYRENLFATPTPLTFFF